MRQRAGSLLLLVLLVLLLPIPAESRSVHYFTCNDCHRSGASLTTLSNLCLRCHTSAVDNPTTMNNNVPTLPTRRFIEDDASNALGSLGVLYNSATAKEISHVWGVNDFNPAAGAAPPSSQVFYGRNNIAKGKVACARCHNSHNSDEVNRLNLKLDNTNDAMCMDCHAQWYVDNTNAYLSHPVGQTVVMGSSDPRFNPGGSVINIYNTATIRLLPGVDSNPDYVSCTSCHGVHYTDSDATTADGYAGHASLDGDGHQLRSDGPTRANKSALCQSCHAYAEHGRSDYEPTNDLDAVNEQVGCLVCHSGHSYDTTSPNYYVLRKAPTTAGFGAKTTLVPTSTTDFYAYCTACHGAVTGYTSRVHSPAENCKGCHDHKATTYSFAMGANAEICGDCHGAPPRSAVKATRGDMVVETGFADGPDVDYNTGAPTQYYKDESRTPHKIHAGALNADKAVVDYAFGSTAGGIDSACNPCHNDRTDTVTPTHDTGVSNGSFQSMAYDSLATYGGVLTAPLYKLNTPNQWTCSGIYCHSNGGKRQADGTKTLPADFKTVLTPAWLNGSNPGMIVGQATECQFCHGEDSASMLSGVRDNSPTHQRHLIKFGGISKTKCYLCHSNTVGSDGVIPATARNHRSGSGGKHVNGVPDVYFDVSALSGGLSTGTYTGGNQGTCAVYCHNPRTTDNAGGTVDWDSYTGVAKACDFCHEGKTGNTIVIDTGAHYRHVTDPNGPKLLCANCHGDNADAGTQTGHIDGTVTYRTPTGGFASICEECHGWETGEAELFWFVPTSVTCESCHTGAKRSTIGGTAAPDKSAALTRGHNRTSNYPVSNNLPGSKSCKDCHSTNQIGHFDGFHNNDKLLVPAAANCTTSCHGVGGSAYKDGIVTHMPLIASPPVCTSCHDPHGDATVANIYMIRSKSSTRYANDLTPVVFSNRGNTADPTNVNANNSFDEDDDGVLAYVAASESNADDLCATCHTAAANTTHNNRDNTDNKNGHNMGKTCLTAGCHGGHTDTAGAFKIIGGTACNDCHDNPPRQGFERYASTNATTFGVHEKHTWVQDIGLSEDRSDCNICHPGAGSYALDHLNGGALNLAAGIVEIGVGTHNYSCGALTNSQGCHLSDSSDGFWKDTAYYGGDGLRCTACHNNDINDGVLANSAPKTGAHTKHVVANKTCTACHNSGVAIVDTQHITNHLMPVDELDNVVLADSAKAVLGEGNVTRSSMVYDQVTNFTCSGGIGLGCHNSKVGPNWRTVTNIACTACHVVTDSDTADPKSGLHNMTQANVQKHDSNITGGCTACHNSTKPTSHADTNWQPDVANNSESRFLNRSGLVYNDTGGPNMGTCFDSGASGAGSLDFAVTCHRDNGVWKRLWTNEADSTATAPGSPRCKACHGQYINLNSDQGGGWNENTSHYLTFGGRSSVRGESHNSRVLGDSSACEDCHSYPSLANHEYGTLNINDGGATNITVDGAPPAARCAACHAWGNPLTDGTFTFTPSAAFSLVAVTGSYDPIMQCNSCHGVGGSGRFWPVGNSADLDNTAGRHEIHMDRLAKKVYGETIAQLLTATTETSEVKQKNLCEYCHTAPAGFSGHHLEALPAEVPIKNLWNKAADTGATYSSNQHGAGGADTCAGVNCHNNKLTVDNSYGWYDVTTGAGCVVCHTVGGANDLPNNNIHPNTGLHNVTPTVSGVKHDDSFSVSGTCGSCHTGIVSAMVGGNHINGTAAADAVNNNDRGLFTAYTDAATNTGTCFGSGVDNSTNCHADGGTWKRRWSTTASVSDGATECANCHGTFAAGWRWDNPAPAGTTDHSDPSALNTGGTGGDAMGFAGMHPDCQICHGWGKAGYLTAWQNKTVGATPGHGDGRITMNGPDDTPGPGAGAKYDDSTWGCAAACHSATWVLSDSGLTPNYGDYGAGSCDGCHGVTGTGQYWPNGSGGNPAYVDDNANSASRHDTHLTTIAQYKWGMTLTQLKANDANQKAACAFCHPSPGVGGHNSDSGDQRVDIAGAGAFRKFTGTTNDAVDAGSSAYASATRSCSNLVCHNLVTTPIVAADAWEGTTAANCTTLCHGPNTVATAREGHQKHVVTKALACTQCHPNNGTNYQHIDGTVTLNFLVTGSMEQTYGSATVANYSDGSFAFDRTNPTGSCTNVYCHVDKQTPAWNATISATTGCVNCHTAGGAGNNPTSGLHNMIANGVQPHNSNLRNGCTECHAPLTSVPPTHIDGVWEADTGTNQSGLQPRFLTGSRTGLVYAEGAANASTCWDNGATGATTSLDFNAGAGCHRDDGKWKRLWSTAADVDIQSFKNPGQLVCDVCHGQYQTLNGSSKGWREGTVHYRSGAAGVAEDKGKSHNRTSGAPVANACDDCHAYPSASGVHENSAINFSGGAGVPGTYTVTWGNNPTPANQGWYCATCHAQSTDDALDTTSHTFPDSTAFATRTYVVGTTQPEGSCNTCHGSPAGNIWPDDTTGHTAVGQYKVVANDINQDGEHAVHVREIAKKVKLPSIVPPTIAEQNATCSYCHPASVHNADTNLPADISRTETTGDNTPDLELSTSMKKIIGGGSDTTGFWRRTPGTCSNVACHARAPFTPHWYGDTVAPGAITDLELQANTEPGTVKLLWNAPGDDDYLDGTAYSYDVRWSTSAINAGNFASANQALAPTVRRQRNSGLLPKNQEVIVKGLPAGTLYFAVKTADERFPNAAAWSLLSNVVSGTAKTDTEAPVFTGVSAVASTDFNFNIEANPDTNGVYVSWEAGRDHSHSLTTPLSYQVLWSTYSLRTHFANGGPMPSPIGTILLPTTACFDKSKTGAQLVQTTCGTITPPSNQYSIMSAQTTALGYAVTGLPVNTVYNFLVRAKDASNNVDSNRVELSAMAKPSAFKPINLRTLKTSAVIPTATTGWTGVGTAITASTSDAPLDANMRGTTGTFTLGTNAIAFSPTTTYTTATNVWGLKFQIKINSGANSATTVTYQFGYLTGKVFTSFAAQQTLTVSKRMPIRLVSFPLANYKGTVPSGSKPAFIVKASQSVTLTYGTEADKGGILLFNEQEYNNLPPAATALGQTQQTSSYIGGPLYRLTWTQPSADANGDAVHYDVFGSTDGTNFPYVIGRNLTTTTVDWDPVGDGITGSVSTARFKVITGDGFREGAMYLNDSTPLNADNDNHNETISSAFTINNTVDIWAPAAIGSASGTSDDLVAETRPKQGGVALTWKAVGNDGFNHGTRATVYDIRFSTSNIPDVTTFNALPALNQATNEQFPDFTGAMERYELLGLNPESAYFFAMRVGDGTNWSGLSNVASTTAGPKCGICHATPPNELTTAGNHIEHGYTMNDCANCHGNDPVLGAQNFKTNHQDGEIRLGWKTTSPVLGVVDGSNRITYTQSATTIYTDPKGGGFNAVAGDESEVDNGTCSGFTGTNTSGCHGPAAPSWQEGVTLECSACHGMTGRTTGTATEYYDGRHYDATLDNNMNVPNQIKASPAVDNHGGSTGKYVGAHLKHLNSSFRLAKGDNCMLCHKEAIHADGEVNVAYDLNVTGADAVWDADGDGGINNPNGGGTCSGTSEVNCHGSTVAEWHSSATVACNKCHGFGGVTPAHVTDPNGGVSTAGTGNCTWCHPAGHPRGTDQDPSSVMIPNNPLVGIAYRSGGIHLRKNINARVNMNDGSVIDTEAEICWGCHEDNAISEWGLDAGANNNTIDKVTLKNDYNYGTLHSDVALATGTTRWVNDTPVGAYWKSGINNTDIQTIKKSRIQSTHSTDPSGTSAVTYDATNKHYDETLDSVAIIRCSNCHDVHNMNKAPNDATFGQPYLRGTWKTNPYAEDAPPVAGTTYAATANFGAVPRGGTDRKYLGGYFIDQNNAQPGTPTTTGNGIISEYPTTGWTTETSAGICVLCHGEDVDNMDQLADSGGLWLGTNGHSNSAIGGTFVNYANIFDNASSSLNAGGLSGRPTPVTGTTWTTQVPDMAYQAQSNAATTTAYGYRGADVGEAALYTPNTTTRYAHVSYNWGATVDGNTPDLMYHQFSCSKCHNPHASRLPKLMITNCLDISHNTWDNDKSQQSSYTAAALTNVDRFAGVGERSAYYASAQNCHRYNQKRKDAGQTNPGGWNKVTPWTTAH